jgi:hypothetical protein
MSSGRERYQEGEGLDLQTEPGLGEPEEKLLRAILGESVLKVLQARDEGFGKRSFDPAVLASVLTGPANDITASGSAFLVQHWIRNHVPTTQINEISILASAVLGDKDKAVRWLSEPNPAMNNRPPIDLVGENNGFDRVKNLLLRIEYGVLG